LPSGPDAGAAAAERGAAAGGAAGQIPTGAASVRIECRVAVAAGRDRIHEISASFERRFGGCRGSGRRNEDDKRQ
ncbi:MAG: hypothetical protein GY788_10360, partial [bacterium]|nr:hypothetical protein [bacterium]